jgi:hypothetical protein
MKKERKTGWFAAFPRQDYFNGRSAAEQRLGKLTLGGDAKVLEPLELREAANHRKHRGHVGRPRRRNAEIIHAPAILGEALPQGIMAMA